MDSSEVLGSINSIYNKFSIPPWLQMHMLRVAGVANQICDNCKEEVHANDIVASMLLHDLGNIIKSDLKNNSTIMGDESKRLEYWESVKVSTITRYGSDEHAATIAMAKEIGVSSRVLHIIENVGVPNIEKVNTENDFEQEICSYSDLRVCPFGILSIQERFADFRERYKNRTKTLTPERFQSVLNSALQMEKDIFSKTSLYPDQINDKTVESYIKKYVQVRR